MSFQGSDQYTHGVQSGIGILLTNLGTPDAPTPAALRRYLAEFLWDPRVVEMNRALWWCVLQGVILRIRPARSARAYQKIWTEQGSPLLTIARRQADALQTVLRQRLPGPLTVTLGMRYGNPSIKDAMLRLRDRGCENILVVPLYPQYASSTTATVVDAVTQVAARLRNQPAMRFIKRFHTHPSFIQPLGDKIAAFWAEHGRPQKLVMSFHGLPRQCVNMGDPYCRDCYETARALAAYLGLTDEQYLVTFQSRFGPAKWLEPYTEPTLERLAKEGVTDVDVVCPGFLADCLETLEEISIEVGETFKHAGGKQFRYIPALNDDPAWMKALAELVLEHLQGWPIRQD